VQPEILELVRQFVHIRSVERISSSMNFGSTSSALLADVEIVNFQHRIDLTCVHVSDSSRNGSMDLA
jgi:hypothetical protein